MKKYKHPLTGDEVYLHGICYDALLVWATQRKHIVDPDLPVVVCLCGSTRFFEAFQEANLKETLAGKIVLTIGCDTKADGDLFGAMTPEELADLKTRLDELHLRKIDLADEVLTLNVGGYIGVSTARELSYARETGKRVRFLEPER